VAALEGMELASALEKALGTWPAVSSARRQKLWHMPWTISVGSDLRMPETVGPRNAAVHFVNWHMKKFHTVAHSDRVPAMAFLRSRIYWHRRKV
jgi:hypothetical protein